MQFQKWIKPIISWLTWCGESIAKCRSQVSATIMKHEAHIETCANTSIKSRTMPKVSEKINK